MRNKLTDVHNHLCLQLERLNDDDFEDLTEEEQEREIRRSRAITNVADKITKNASLILEAQKYMDEYHPGSSTHVPDILAISNNPNKD